MKKISTTIPIPLWKWLLEEVGIEKIPVTHSEKISAGRRVSNHIQSILNIIKSGTLVLSGADVMEWDDSKAKKRLEEKAKTRSSTIVPTVSVPLDIAEAFNNELREALQKQRLLGDESSALAPSPPPIEDDENE